MRGVGARRCGRARRGRARQRDGRPATRRARRALGWEPVAPRHSGRGVLEDWLAGMFVHHHRTARYDPAAVERRYYGRRPTNAAIPSSLVCSERARYVRRAAVPTPRAAASTRRAAAGAGRRARFVHLEPGDGAREVSGGVTTRAVPTAPSRPGTSAARVVRAPGSPDDESGTSPPQA